MARRVLGVLRGLPAIGTGPSWPVDDVQWLDPGTRRVLSFALRRFVTSRSATDLPTGGRGAPDADLGLARRPVDGRTGHRRHRGAHSSSPAEHDASRPTLTRLHQATGGNPMVCLEMARALQRRGERAGADEPLPCRRPSQPGDRAPAGLHPPSRRLLLLTPRDGPADRRWCDRAMGELDSRPLSPRGRPGRHHRARRGTVGASPTRCSPPSRTRTCARPPRRLHARTSPPRPSPIPRACASRSVWLVRSRRRRRRCPDWRPATRGAGAASRARSELAELAIDRTPRGGADLAARRSVEAADF